MKFPKTGERPSPSRRRFLTLRQERRSHAGRLDRAFESRHWVRVGRRAMACLFEFILPPTARPRLMEIHRILDEIDRYESLMTVYREDSHLSEINREAFGKHVVVDESVFPLLMLSQRLWEETGGAFDITAGPLTRCWGFFERLGRVPERTELREVLGRMGMQHVELDPLAKTVTFGQQVELNLGAIGKGYALDRAAARLSDAGFADVLVHAGNSSILARGSYEPHGRQGWPLALQHPTEDGTNVASVRLRDCAMSTSGIREQQFVSEGRRFGHILDPRTGYPAEHRLSATAFAGTAAEADGLSTAFFVMGDEEIQAFCENKTDVGAILINCVPSTGEVSVSEFGMAEEFVEDLCD